MKKFVGKTLYTNLDGSNDFEQVQLLRDVIWSILWIMANRGQMGVLVLTREVPES